MKNTYYLGPKDSYSYLIVKKVLNDAVNLMACNSFVDIVKNTLADETSIGVLPIENSITGNIHENIDYLYKEKLTILAEASLEINIHLIGFKDARKKDIEKVYSHPNALSQCRGYIRSHNLMTQGTVSTAAAKDMILKRNDKRVAAIGSRELANDEHLKIIDENIGDEKYSLTRFLFVSLQPTQGFLETKNKLSVMFALPHQPGTLAKVLAEFAKARFNLTKIDSRPIPGTTWEYLFWVDVEDKGKGIDKHKLSSILSQNTVMYKIIGIYAKGARYES